MKTAATHVVKSLTLLATFAGLSACFDIGLGDSAGTKALDQEQTIEVSEATTLNLANQFGAVTVIGEADRTEIEMVPTLHSDDPEAGTITVLNSGDEVSVAVASLGDDEVAVDIEVRTPENLIFTIATGGGALNLSGMVGGGESATGDGDATVDMDLADGEDLQIVTGAGVIDLTLASDTVADLAAVAAGGSVSIDAALDFDGTNMAGVADGTLNGGGGASIDLTTGGGDIGVNAR